MDATTAKGSPASAPGFDGEYVSSLQLRGEAVSENGLDAKDRPNHEFENTPATDAKTEHVPSSLWTADTVNGDSNGVSTVAPIPLTNGHQEEPDTAPDTKGDFDDIWSPATKLKRRLENTKDLIVCPGVYDGFSARIALSVGFDAMYMV